MFLPVMQHGRYHGNGDYEHSPSDTLHAGAYLLRFAGATCVYFCIHSLINHLGATNLRLGYCRVPDPLSAGRILERTFRDLESLELGEDLAPSRGLGVETSIVVSGAFTRGGQSLRTRWLTGRGRSRHRIRCESADPAAVANAVVDIVNAPFGMRPSRVVIDPASDGAVVEDPPHRPMRAPMISSRTVRCIA
jgi:hypothetical protein